MRSVRLRRGQTAQRPPAQRSALGCQIEKGNKLQNEMEIGEVRCIAPGVTEPFDLPDGFQLFLPTADCYSLRIGRIEGVGVAPAGSCWDGRSSGLSEVSELGS